jgi:NADH-quinone oxidoreductase subunit C
MTQSATTNQALAAKLQARFGEATIEYDRGGRVILHVPGEHYLATIAALRSEPELGFDILVQVFGEHHPDAASEYTVTVLLTSMSLGAQLAVRVAAVGASPTVPSLALAWRAANWHEREVLDMFGIHFEGHPDPERMFLPPETEFHPLRKDFPVEGLED